MSNLSGIKDVDREILNKLDDKELLNACSIDKYTWNTICDDAFFKSRLLSKYPQIERYKFVNESWKQFFLRSIYYISKMKEENDYEYSFGNFVTQYKLFQSVDIKGYIKGYNGINYLLINSAEQGELALVIWSLKKGANIHSKWGSPLRYASKNGHLDVVKYLVEKGANIHAEDETPIIWAIKNGHLEVVKYLAENGADISNLYFYLILADQNGHKEVENYLKSKKNVIKIE